MPRTIQLTDRINSWKQRLQKEQLHKTFIKSGYCPSHYLMNKITVLAIEEAGQLVEEFYINRNTADEFLLLRSTLLLEKQQLFFEGKAIKKHIYQFEEEAFHSYQIL